MMQTFDTITDARNAIMDFRADHGAEIPALLRPRFRELSASPSPVDQIVGVGEFIWANRERFTGDIANPARDLGAGLIAFATTNAWHGLLEDDRGNAIVANFRKEMGEIQRAPAAPEARQGFYVEDPEAPAAPIEPAAPPEGQE